MSNAALNEDIAKFTDAGASDPLARAIADSINDVRQKSTITGLKRTIITVTGTAIAVVVAATTLSATIVFQTASGLRSEITASRNELKADTAALRSEMVGRFATTQASNEAKFDGLHTKLDLLLRQQTTTPRP